VPPLRIRQAGRLSKLATAVGWEDIEVGDDDLDARFRVSGDEGFAAAFFTPEVRAGLLAADLDGVTIELGGEGAVIYTRGRTGRTAGQLTPIADALAPAIVGSVETWRDREAASGS
jgi:hypothetical protein